ncbi:hypothetical protein MASR2M78_28790 [Treponema sp.]
MIDSSTLRGLCIFLSVLIIGIFGFLEKKTGIPFISDLSFFIPLVVILCGITVVVFYFNNKAIKEEEEEEKK